MLQQTLIWTALPRSVRQSGNQRVIKLAAFLAPRLEESQIHPLMHSVGIINSGLFLSNYPDFADWPAKAKSLAFFVSLNNAPYTQAKVTGVVMPHTDLWKAIFAPDVPVTPYTADNLSSTALNVAPSWESHHTLQKIYSDLILQYGGNPIPPQQIVAHPGIAKIIGHLQPQSVPPIIPSGPAGFPAAKNPPEVPPPTTGAGTSGQAAAGSAAQNKASDTVLPPKYGPISPAAQRAKLRKAGIPSGLRTDGRIHLDPKSIAKQSRNAGGCFMILQSILRIFRSPLMLHMPGDGFGLPSSNRPAALNLGQAGPRTLPIHIRDFIKPNPIMPLPNLNEVRQQYDFHQIISSLGSHPELLAELGLVIELEVEAPPQTPGTGVIAVMPQWSQTQTPTKIHATQTAYYLDNAIFRAQSSSESTIRNGYLRVDDQNQFTVAQTDAIAGVMKIEQSGSQWLGIAAETNSAQGSGVEGDTLPAIRTHGLALTHNDSFVTNFMAQRIQTASILQQQVYAQNNQNNSAVVYAEDILRGFRADIWDEKAHKWHSLHETQTDYRFLRNQSLNKSVQHEGYMQFAATGSSQSGLSHSLTFSGQLFLWDGWSLSAPRPGKVVNDDFKDTANPVVQVNNDSVTAAEMQFISKPRKGSLPRLRFGRAYRLRVRTVDLSGYSQVTPTEAQFQQTPPECTDLITFGRYDPIGAPIMVLGNDPVNGESVNTPVIRNGDGAAPSVNESIRWILPPKISQRTSEWHGMFDGATHMNSDINGYTTATREAATLEKAMQNGVLTPIPGVTAVTQTNPKNLAEPKTLYIKYSGTTAYPVAYLPDPLAKGIKLEIRSADSKLIGRCLHIPQNLQWPNYPAYKLRVTGMPASHAPEQPVVKQEGAVAVIDVKVPAGEIYYAALSSITEEEHLKMLSHWNRISALPQSATIKPTILNGASWAFTPSDFFTIMHAVRTPVVDPQFLGQLRPERAADSTRAFLLGEYTTHTGSTTKVDLESQWTDLIDDGKSPQGAVQTQQAMHVMEQQIDMRYRQSIPAQNNTPELAKIGLEVIHTIGDTKYHRITYRLSGVSRFKDCYPLNDTTPVIAPAAGSSAPKSEQQVDILNTVSPASPEIPEVLPVFEWKETASQGMIRRARRGSILRVYLKRPWFQSGNGEMLGVVYLNQPSAEIPQALLRFSTIWGRDPIHMENLTAAFSVNPSGNAEAGAVFQDKHFIDAKTFQTVALQERPDIQVRVAGHSVQFDSSRNAWYADIAVHAPNDYFPFIRFALVRFQPNSIYGAHISRVVMSDYFQVLPDRVIAIIPKRPIITVTVEGKIPQSNRIEATIEQYFTTIGGEFGWQQIGSLQISGRTDTTVSFTGTVPAEAAGARIRAAIREYEPIDNRDSYTFGQVFTTRMPWRMVYADDREIQF